MWYGPYVCACVNCGTKEAVVETKEWNDLRATSVVLLFSVKAFYIAAGGDS